MFIIATTFRFSEYFNRQVNLCVTSLRTSCSVCTPTLTRTSPSGPFIEVSSKCHCMPLAVLDYSHCTWLRLESKCTAACNSAFWVWRHTRLPGPNLLNILLKMTEPVNIFTITSFFSEVPTAVEKNWTHFTQTECSVCVCVCFRGALFYISAAVAQAVEQVAW